MLKTKKIVSALCTVALTLCIAPIAGCGGQANNTADPQNESSNATSTTAESDSAAPTSAEANTSDSQYAQGVHHAVLRVQGYEPIEITLDADAAPITVENFANLVQDGYYNGKTFYRFQDGFCMQGGTLGNSTSGNDPSVETIVGEFSSNGHSNTLADNFGRGTVAMARTSEPDSATTTFFVTLGDGPTVSASLDGQYAAFGAIDENGMAIVDQIVADHVGDADSRMGIVDDESKQALIESIEMVD